MRKKIFTFLLALTASIGMMWAETVVVINKSEFTSSGVTKEGVTLALSNGSMTSSDIVAMNGSFEFSTSLGKFTGITIETDANIMEIYEGAFTSAGWPTGDNLGTSAAWTGESETVLISCMVAGMDNITITCTIEPTPSVTAARFVYNYDCQRSPAYPKKETACTLSGFRDPYEGYKGTKNGNIALGPWKLEFVAYYTPSNNYGCASQVNTAVYQYYSNLSSEEREAKKLEMPIFRLWQYNLTAREYQPATYGIVCAYAGEANAQDHAALFISSNSYGCFLTGHQHTSSFALTCENDLTTGLAALVAAASASDPELDSIQPVIVSIDAIGPVELSEHCKYYIEGSRAAYDALTDEQKAQITNYSTLTNAETQWADLAAAAQPYADAVIDLINAIPNPVVYTQDCKDKIDAAQDAYDALTDGQKVLVTNAETLLQAPIAFINVAHPNILFTADNSNIKRIEDVTLPKSFTAGYFSTDNEFLGILKELYGINEDAYINFIYSNNDAVTRSGNNLTVNPFSGTATVSGNIVIMSTSNDSPYSVDITLELPPFGPAPAPANVDVATNQDPLSPSMHYSTFFHSTQNYALTGDGTQAFIAKINGGDFVLTKIADGTQVIPANTAVIFCKSGSSDPIVLSPTDEAGVSVNPDNNSLRGVDEATALSSLSIAQDNCYVLSGTAEHGVGFYKINTTTLLAHKAFYAHVAAGAPPRRIRFVYSEANEATGMENVQGDNVQSTKVLEDGVIYIERNGVRYNAQGQIVK